MTKRVRKNGLYKRYFDNGKQLSEENYNDGMLEGKWTYWYENGQVKLKANFKPYEVLPEDERWERSSRYVFPARDSKHGKWTEWYENGQKKREQNYECGRVIGKWTSWHENGNKKSVSNYQDGGLPGMSKSIADGKFIEWYENGQKKIERCYQTNRAEGMWTEWEENGQIIEERYYKMGELQNWKITKIPKFSD
jgi:antitoxin component YwqK of YwqJK toxin-antitoxin module